MGLSNELSCESGSFSHHHNPHRFFQPEVLKLSFPTLEPWVVWSVSLPSCSSRFIRVQIWDYPPAITMPHALSDPGANLDEYFFFNSLVARLLYSLIFWQFWLFSVFTFVVVLLFVVRGGKVYLPVPPSWPDGWIFVVYF